MSEVDLEKVRERHPRVRGDCAEYDWDCQLSDQSKCEVECQIFVCGSCAEVWPCDAIQLAEEVERLRKENRELWSDHKLHSEQITYLEGLAEQGEQEIPLRPCDKGLVEKLRSLVPVDRWDDVLMCARALSLGSMLLERQRQEKENARLREVVERTEPPQDTVRLLPARPVVVTLCGSTRFMDAFFEVGWALTLQGKIVLSVGVCKHAEDHGGEALGGDVCERLDELHWRKIDLSDEIMVLNIGGYIGESTQAEIKYAERTGKRVVFLEESPRAALPATGDTEEPE